MATSISLCNAIATEGGANTYANAKAEIPNTNGARKVILVEGLLDVDTPDLEDALNDAKALAYVGDKTTNTSIGSLATAGCIGYVQERLNSDATDIIFESGNSPQRTLGGVEVPRAQDGKFYITLEVKGNGNANPKSAKFAGTFAVER